MAALLEARFLRFFFCNEEEVEVPPFACADGEARNDDRAESSDASIAAANVIAAAMTLSIGSLLFLFIY